MFAVTFHWNGGLGHALHDRQKGGTAEQLLSFRLLYFFYQNISISLKNKLCFFAKLKQICSQVKRILSSSLTTQIFYNQITINSTM